MEELRKNCRAN